MSKYIKVILIETIIVTIYVVSLYFYRTSTCSCTTGPHCAFSDDFVYVLYDMGCYRDHPHTYKFVID